MPARLFRRNINVGEGVAVYDYAHFALSPVKMDSLCQFALRQSSPFVPEFV
jgi:hypothetical protein